MDVHVKRAVTSALRLRGIDVLTAQADGATRLSDPELLDRATAAGRVLFTQDEDFLTEAARRRKLNLPFATILYAHQSSITVRDCVESIELFCRTALEEERRNLVLFLPF
jgi:predicted nuclease of predicted toxin-antitoxin system